MTVAKYLRTALFMFAIATGTLRCGAVPGRTPSDLDRHAASWEGSGAGEWRAVHQPELDQPKDASRLEREAVRDVLCADDAVCPVGAYCDLAAMRCDLDCFEGSDELALQCPAGTFCDLRGQCQPLAADGSEPGVQAFSWAQLPARLKVEGETEFRADIQQLGGSAALLNVQVQAGPGLEVACRQGSSQWTWGRRCILSTQQEATESRRYSVAMMLRWAAEGAAERSTVTLISSLARPRIVEMEVVGPSVLSRTKREVLKGFARRHGNPNYSLPISATRIDDHISIIDSHRLAFGERSLEFSWSRGTEGKKRSTVWLTASQPSEAGGDLHILGSSGQISARWSASEFTESDSTGALAGQVEVKPAYGQSTVWDLELWPMSTPVAEAQGDSTRHGRTDEASSTPFTTLTPTLAQRWKASLPRIHPALQALRRAQVGMPEVMLDASSASEAGAIDALRHEPSEAANDENNLYCFDFEPGIADDEPLFASQCSVLLQKITPRRGATPAVDWQGRGILVRDGRPQGNQLGIKRYKKSDLVFASEAWAAIAPALWSDYHSQQDNGEGQDPWLWTRKAVYEQPAVGRSLLYYKGNRQDYASAPVLDSRALVDRCIADLQRTPDDETNDSPECLNPTHFYRVLGTLEDAALKAVGQLSEGEGKLANFLLARWMLGHAIIAHQFLREAEYHSPRVGFSERNKITPGDRQEIARMPLAKLLLLFNNAWSLLLSPSVMSILLEMPTQALTHPAIPPPGEDTAEDYFIARGMLVTGMELANLHLRVLSLAASGAVTMEDQGSNEANDQQRKMLDQIRREGLRLVTAAESSLSALAEAAEGEREPHWKVEYYRSKRRYDRVAAVAPWAGRTEGEEVPLVFGDAAGTAGQYFAASDHMTSLFNKALNKLTQVDQRVREQWVRYVNQQNIEETTKIQEDRHEESIKRHYGAEIVRLCGTDDVLPEEVLPQLQNGEFDLERCYTTGDQADERKQLNHDSLRGEIGAAIAHRLQMQDELETAHKTLEELSQRVSLQAIHCEDLQADLREEQRDKQQHTDLDMSRRDELSDARHIGIVARNAQAAGGIVNTICSFGLNIVAAAANTSAEMWEEHINRDREKSEAALNLALSQRHNNRQLRDCQDSLRNIEISRKSTVAQVTRRIDAWKAATIDVEDRINLLHQLADEGQKALSRQRIAAPQLAGIFADWLDADTQEYARNFQRSKRIGDYALRALEYELQTSLPARGRLNAARLAQELEKIAEEIQDIKATPLVRGQPPQHSVQIVSLRRDVLRWYDEDRRVETNRPDVQEADTQSLWQLEPVSAAEKFRRTLSGPQSAVWDARGTYLGQGFALLLDPELLCPRLGERARSSTSTCAERIWRVNAMLVGQFAHSTGHVMGKISIYKSPSFFSRWSNLEERPNPYQVGRLGVPKNLGIDGGKTETAAMDVRGSRAILQPRCDITESVFAGTGYIDGSSEAFAGQGLYGEYLLVLDPESPILSSEITDVILKFDYLHAIPG